ncbi:MAG: S24 family peptidase [Gammaproteobacteria bacterium]
MINKLKSNLQQLLAARNQRQADLARETQLPHSLLSRIFSNPEPNPTFNTLATLANYFSISISQLVGEEPLPDETIIHKRNRANYVPFIVWENIPAWAPKKLSTFVEKFIVMDSASSDTLFCTQLVDTTMEPRFPSGTLLAFDPTQNPHDQDFVLAYLKKSKHVLFRQLFTNGEEWMLKPLNCDFKPLESTQKECTVLGILVSAQMYFKD